jgi:hypothetical protein
MNPRVEQADARPAELLIPEARQHQRWRYIRVTVIAIVAALVIAALAAVSVIFYQRSSSSLGEVRTAQLKTASSSCRAFWAKAIPLFHHVGNFPATLPPYLLGDVGEQNAALLYQDSQYSMVCFLSSPSSVVGVGTAGTSRTPSAAHPVTLSSPALYTDVNAKFQLVTGQALGGVTSITLTLSDGTVVHPALGHGYFIAWWPGMAPVVSSTFVDDGSVQHSGGAPSSPFQHPSSPFQH